MIETIALAIGLGLLLAIPLVGLFSLPSMLLRMPVLQAAKVNSNRPFISRSK